MNRSEIADFFKKICSVVWTEVPSCIFKANGLQALSTKSRDWVGMQIWNGVKNMKDEINSQNLCDWEPAGNFFHFCELVRH